MIFFYFIYIYPAGKFLLRYKAQAVLHKNFLAFKDLQMLQGNTIQDIPAIPITHSI